ncbi:hypothetical protein Hanom_Chr10g00936311 [Helianthus anomalus]
MIQSLRFNIGLPPICLQQYSEQTQTTIKKLTYSTNNITYYNLKNYSKITNVSHNMDCQNLISKTRLSTKGGRLQLNLAYELC